MNYIDLRKLIKNESSNDDNSFEDSGDLIQQELFSIDKDSLIKIIDEIGTIPEDIDHDSSEEKLYSKATDIVLAKSFHELGINSNVNKERANCADVIGKSSIHGYSLVGDAKAFRLSRTAKNQKDFKVNSMVNWKGDNDYSVLVCPYYQYPKRTSQIYGQALDGNVCLLSWEHLSFLLKNNIKESKITDLSPIWNMSALISESVTIKDKDKNTNFHEIGNKIICEHISIDYEELIKYFDIYRKLNIKRGKIEIKYWEKRIEEIMKFSKKQAIEELIIALKLNEKISAINKYINALKG